MALPAENEKPVILACHQTVKQALFVIRWVPAGVKAVTPVFPLPVRVSWVVLHLQVKRNVIVTGCGVFSPPFMLFILLLFLHTHTASTLFRW